MDHFGWIGPTPDPPPDWDLRQNGWQLCRGHGGRVAECRHILVVDVRSLSPTERRALADADRPAWRLLLLGVERSFERAQLLAGGCAEALAADVSLRELSVRARNVAKMLTMLPRWRDVGPLVLDLFQRDARFQGRWMGLHPREFGLLWRLADLPGATVTRDELLRDVWRMAHDPGTNSIGVHVSRLRAKLSERGCPPLVETAPSGGYRIADTAPTAAPFMFAGQHPPVCEGLDAYLRTCPFSEVVQESDQGQ